MIYKDPGLKSSRKYIPRIRLRATACSRFRTVSFRMRATACVRSCSWRQIALRFSGRPALLPCYSPVIDTLEHLPRFPLQRGAHLLHLRLARRSCCFASCAPLSLATQNQGQMSGQGSPPARRTTKAGICLGGELAGFFFQVASLWSQAHQRTQAVRTVQK